MEYFELEIQDGIKLKHNYKNHHDLIEDIEKKYISLEWDFNDYKNFNIKKSLLEVMEHFLTSTQHLYFITSTDMEYVKIGISNNVDKRLKQLKKSTPFDIELYKSVDYGGVYEHSLHTTYKSNNTTFDTAFDGSTEWFILDDKLKRYIDSVDIKKLKKKYG